MTEQEAILELSKVIEAEVLIEMLTKESALTIIDKLCDDIMGLL